MKNWQPGRFYANQTKKLHDHHEANINAIFSAPKTQPELERAKKLFESCEIADKSIK